MCLWVVLASGTSRTTPLWVGSIVAVYFSIAVGLDQIALAPSALLAFLRQRILSVVQRLLPLVLWTPLLEQS